MHLILLLKNIIRFVCLFYLLLSYLVAIERTPDAFKITTVQEKLGQNVTSNIYLKDSLGNIVDLKSFFVDKTVLINFAYFTCPKLCHLIVDSMTQALSEMKQKDLDKLTVLTISFDHRDDLNSTRMFKNKHFTKFKESTNLDINWEFLYGDSETISRLTKSLGFRYFYNEKSNQYSHSSVLVFLSPFGRVTRYLYGIMFSSFDFKMSILESLKNKSVSTVESVLLFCYNYDPDEKGYVIEAVKLMKYTCVFTVIIIISLLFNLGFKTKKVYNGE